MQQTLNTRQNRRDIISRTPPILQDIQTQLSVRVHVRVKHLREEFDGRRFVRVGFVEI